MLYVLLGVVTLVLILWSYFEDKNPQRAPELSGRWPIVGHGFKVIGDSKKMFDTLMSFCEESIAVGGVASIHMANRKIYIVADPEDSLTISNACLNKPYIYDFAKPFLGNGLVTAPASIWRRHRKLLNPAFSQSVLDSFIPTFNKQARILTDQFAKEVGKPFDHEELLRLNNLETICLTAMGIDNQGQFSDLQKRYVPLMTQFLMILTERFKHVWLHSDLIFNWSAMKRRQDKLAKDFVELSNTILQVKKKEMKMRTSAQNKSTKLKPFIELILDLTNETQCFTDDDVREETDSIVAAGHDTSASVLTFALTILGTYQDIQDKVYKEVTDVFGDTDRDLNKDDLSKLVYTEAVLKETIRLYPVAPLVARNVTKPVKLRKYTVEANTSCFIFVRAINRHPMWGADADEFRPERWLEDSLPNLEYFGGFGLGKRGCIGKVYAMMSMKIQIAHLMRRYRVNGDVSKMVLKWDVMSRPESGHFITLQPRK